MPSWSRASAISVADVDGEHDFRCATVLDHAAGHFAHFMQRGILRRQRGRRVRIDGLDHGHAFVADAGDDADRPQQARRVVDQEQEVGDARDAENPGDRCDQLVHRLFLPVERSDGEHQREHEQADAVADDVVAQQDRGDDSRRQLAACDLDRHQQRAEREHQERQRQRDDGLIQRRCAVG